MALVDCLQALTSHRPNGAWKLGQRVLCWQAGEVLAPNQDYYVGSVASRSHEQVEVCSSIRLELKQSKKQRR